MRKNAKKIKRAQDTLAEESVTKPKQVGEKEHGRIYSYTKDLGVPVVLAVIGIGASFLQFDMEENRIAEQRAIEKERISLAEENENKRAEAQSKIANDIAEKTIVADFLNKVSDLITDKGLTDCYKTTSTAKDVKTVATSLSVTALRQLTDPENRNAIFTFLSNSMITNIKGCVHIFEGANLRRADLREANLTGTNLQNANLWEADLRRATLLEADLQDAVLTSTDLREATLWKADLRKANLREANLRRVDLAGANLREANLWKADLRKAALGDADLREAKLRGVDLTGANFVRALNLTQDMIEITRSGDAETKLPKNLRKPQHWVTYLKDMANKPNNAKNKEYFLKKADALQKEIDSYSNQ